ncbi:MAG: YqgE/AlgH family protein [Thermodesulfobacteriota bacterium]
MPEPSGAMKLKGEFLIAMPQLADPNFRQTVVCIREHSPEGALGLIVNRIYPNLTAKDIFEELKMEFDPQSGHIPVHNGGPVHTGDLFVLHEPPFGWEGCRPMRPELALTNTKDILMAIAQGKGPRRFLVLLGYAGWGPGQLETELKENSWLTVPVNAGIIFDAPLNRRWADALKLMNIADPAFLSGVSGRA